MTAVCAGRRCPFRTRVASKVVRGQIDVRKRLGKAVRFRTGQTLELRITAPKHRGQAVRFRFRKGKRPVVSTLCIPPGAKTPKRCGA